MKTHNFTIIASAAGPAPEQEMAECLFEAGCDDATVSVQKGVVILEFDREARTFISALLSAVRDVEKAGLEVGRIEPDHLVSASDIAKRSGLGRAAISLYASGSRGHGFPHPVARVTTDSPLWDWVEVASWMHREKKLSREVRVQARLVREINRILASGGPFPSLLRRKMKEQREAERKLETI